MDTNTPASKYDFFEVVEVTKPRGPRLQGYILGKAQEDDGHWSYAVMIYSLQEAWYTIENEIRSLGRFDEIARHEYKHRKTVKVVVDSETGEGRLAD